MLILPPGHHPAVAATRGLSRRERWMVGGVLSAVLAVALVVAISLASTGPSSSRGCIHAVVPGPVGAQQIDQCGSVARGTCASLNRPGGYPPSSAAAIAAECRRAGLAVGA